MRRKCVSGGAVNAPDNVCLCLTPMFFSRTQGSRYVQVFHSAKSGERPSCQLVLLWLHDAFSRSSQLTQTLGGLWHEPLSPPEKVDIG